MGGELVYVNREGTGMPRQLTNNVAHGLLPTLRRKYRNEMILPARRRFAEPGQREVGNEPT
jgi:hypothetical protein